MILTRSRVFTGGHRYNDAFDVWNKLMKQLILLVVIVVVAVGLAFMSLPQDPGRVEAPAPIPEQPAEGEDDGGDIRQSAIEMERDARLEAMKARYAELEKERRNLRQRLNKVGYYLAETELSKAEARTLQDELDAANRILINPPLLGAFRSVEDIQQERDRIARINDRLDEIEAVVDAPPDEM